MWVYWPDRDDFWDDETSTSDPNIARALAMRQEWEMNHWIPRLERCRIIAEADKILWLWQEDYRD